MNDVLRRKLQDLPDKPGCYLMRDRAGKIIYVGKAVSLRKRVQSYFRRSTFLKAPPKLRGLINSVEDLDVVVVRNEAEALLTEGQLIKDYKPRFNVVFRDDKRYLAVRALAILGENPAVVLVRPTGDVEELAQMAALLVGAAVADPARGLAALRAFDELALAAEPGASPVFAQRAFDEAFLHVLADPADLACLAVDALVATPVEALGAQAGVLLEFPGEGGCGAIQQLAHLLEGPAHAKPRLECRPVRGRHVFLSFGHCFLPVFSPAGVDRDAGGACRSRRAK